MAIWGAKVVENMPNSGQVKIVYKGAEMLVKYGDVRRHMPYASLTLEFATQTGTAPHTALQIVERILEGCEARKLYTFGYILNNGKWQLTRL